MRSYSSLLPALTPEEQATFDRLQYERRNPPKSKKAITTKSSTKTAKDIFTPQSFKDYVGQSDAKDLAKIAVKAALKEKRALPNLMIVGEYGLGKTSLARVILNEMSEPVIMYDGSSINNELPKKGTFIIDEIHNLDPNVADTLNLHLDSGKYHIIGCTNMPGKLPSAFRSRFRTIQLNHYQPEDLKVIARHICERKGIKADSKALDLLSERSRYNARQTIMYLSLIFDMMSVGNKSTLTVEVVNGAFNKLGVDSQGLLPRDRQYIEALPRNRPVGLQYLSAVLGMDSSTIEDEVEPYLLRMGLINRSPRGREKIAG